MEYLALAGKWLISNPWRLVAMALLVTVGFYHFWTVPHLESTIKSRDLTIANQKTDIEKLKGAIALQNQAVENWKATATKASENQKAAMAVAEKAMDRAKDTVTKIEKEPVPTPDKECTATLEILRKYQS
jgi:F0F1-type ATP synthase membrane subunit b/b'